MGREPGSLQADAACDGLSQALCLQPRILANMELCGSIAQYEYNMLCMPEAVLNRDGHTTRTV